MKANSEPLYCGYSDSRCDTGHAPDMKYAELVSILEELDTGEWAFAVFCHTEAGSESDDAHALVENGIAETEDDAKESVLRITERVIRTEV